MGTIFNHKNDMGLSLITLTTHVVPDIYTDYLKLVREGSNTFQFIVKQTAGQKKSAMLCGAAQTFLQRIEHFPTHAHAYKFVKSCKTP